MLSSILRKQLKKRYPIFIVFVSFVFSLSFVVGLSIIEKQSNPQILGAFSWPIEGSWSLVTANGVAVADHEERASCADPTRNASIAGSNDVASQADCSGPAPHYNPGNNAQPGATEQNTYSAAVLYNDANNDSVGCANIVDDYIYFRTRIVSTPLQTNTSAGFTNDFWWSTFELTGDGITDFYVRLDGNSDRTAETLDVIYETSGDNDPTGEPVIVSFVGPLDLGLARGVETPDNATVGDSTQYFVDWQVPVTAFQDDLGNQQICANTNLVLSNYSTSANANNPFQKDFLLPAGSFSDPFSFAENDFEVDKTYTDLNGGGLQINDIVEYEVTFKNTANTLTDIEILDQLPANTTFITNSYGVNSGIQVEIAGNTYNYTNTNDLPDAAGCPLSLSCSGDFNLTNTGAITINIDKVFAALSPAPLYDSVVIRYRVSLDAPGIVSNQAFASVMELPLPKLSDNPNIDDGSDCTNVTYDNCNDSISGNDDLTEFTALSPTPTPTNTNTPTPTPTQTPIPTNTYTPTPTPSDTPGPTPTNTPTPSNSGTPIPTNSGPTNTNTPSPTNTSGNLTTNTPTPTLNPTLPPGVFTGTQNSPDGNVRITKIPDIPSDSVVFPGQELVFTLLVEITQDKEIGVKIVDEIDPHLTYLEGKTSIDEVFKTEDLDSDEFSQISEKLIFTFDELQPGRYSIKYTLKVNERAKAGSNLIDNVFSYRSAETKKFVSNKLNYSYNPVYLTKEYIDVNGGFPELGDLVVWQMKVINNSGETQTNVLVEDIVPDGTEYIPGSGIGPGFDESDIPNLSWEIDEIADQQVITISYDVKITQTGLEIENIANYDCDLCIYTHSDDPNTSEPGDGTVMGVNAFLDAELEDTNQGIWPLLTLLLCLTHFICFLLMLLLLRKNVLYHAVTNRGITEVETKFMTNDFALATVLMNDLEGLDYLLFLIHKTWKLVVEKKQFNKLDKGGRIFVAGSGLAYHRRDGESYRYNYEYLFKRKIKEFIDYESILTAMVENSVDVIFVTQKELKALKDMSFKEQKEFLKEHKPVTL